MQFGMFDIVWCDIVWWYKLLRNYWRRAACKRVCVCVRACVRMRVRAVGDEKEDEREGERGYV